MGKHAKAPPTPKLPPDPDEPATIPVGPAAYSREALGITMACDVDPERVEWIIDDELAVGKMTILAGEGGDGKSQKAARDTAAITTGAFPDGTRPNRTGSCIYLAAEDGVKDTLVPRLIAAGADRSKVAIVDPSITTVKDGKKTIHPQSFQNLEYWRALIAQFPDLRLIIADPIPAFLGRGVNDHKNAELREALTPLLRLLDEHGVAMLAITHLGKSADGRSPIDRLLGSVAYKNLARVVQMTTRDPDDKERRLLYTPKNNLGPERRKARAYRIVGQEIEHKGAMIATSAVVFEAAEVELDIADAMGGEKAARRRGPSPEKTMAVAQWLHDHLEAERVPVPLAAIFDAAGEKGFVGTKRDGKWSNPKIAYDARQMVAALPDPRSGKRVDECKFPLGGNGRAIVHWFLSPVGPEGASE